MKAGQSQSKEDHAPINDFNGHYQFLNNDHPAWVNLDGDLYPSASIAYQAARTTNYAIRQQLLQVETYQKFKQICLSIQNPADWSHRKYRVMERLIRDKFKRNKELSSRLAATNPRSFVNSFKSGGQNEQYWGMVDGKGFNALGKILMGIRQQILNGTDWQKWIADQGLSVNPKLRPVVSLVVIKQNKPIDKLFLQKKSRFFFGALSSSDYKLDHPSISKQHACMYFGEDLNIMLVDLGSSNGTSLLREGKTYKLEPLKPISLVQGDLISFGLSSRKYRIEIESQSAAGDKQKKPEDQQKPSNGEIKSKSRSRSRSPRKKTHRS